MSTYVWKSEISRIGVVFESRERKQRESGCVANECSNVVHTHCMSRESHPIHGYPMFKVNWVKTFYQGEVVGKVIQLY